MTASFISANEEFKADEKPSQAKSGVWVTATVADLKHLEDEIDETSRERTEKTTKIKSEADLAYKCIVAELKKQPSQIISDLAYTLRNLAVKGIEEHHVDSRKAQQDLLSKFKGMVQDLKRDYEAKLAAQLNEKTDKFGYLRKLARNTKAGAQLGIKDDTEPAHKRTSISDRGAVPAASSRVGTTPKESWDETLGTQHTNGGDKKESHTLPGSTQALPGKGTSKTKQFNSPMPEHWSMSRARRPPHPSTSQHASSSWNAADQSADPDKNVSEGDSGMEGLLRREDELLDHLIKNGAQPGNGEVSEGMTETLQILGWKVKQLEAENERLRSQVQEQVLPDKNQPHKTGQTPGAQGVFTKMTRWADQLATTLSVVDSIPSTTKPSTPDGQKRRLEGLTDTPQVSGPHNILPLVNELVALDFGSGLSTPATANYLLTPPPQRVSVALSARATSRHTPTLAAVPETTSNGIQVPRVDVEAITNGIDVPGRDVETTSNGVEVDRLDIETRTPKTATSTLNSPYYFPRLPLREVPNEGALSYSIVWSYIYNVLFGVLEPPMHAIFWALLIFRELGQAWRFISFYLNYPGSNAAPPRLPVLPIMPARSLVGLALYSIVYMTANMYTATSRERDIWTQANRMTRTYMLQTARNPQSWMGIPGVDGNLTIGFKDLVEKLGQARAFLEYHLGIVYVFAWDAIKSWVAFGVQELDDWVKFAGRYAVNRTVEANVSDATVTAILTEMANVTDSG